MLSDFDVTCPRCANLKTPTSEPPQRRPLPKPRSGPILSSAELHEPSLIFALLGFFIPLVGFVLYFIKREEAPLKARSALRGAYLQVGVQTILILLISIGAKVRPQESKVENQNTESTITASTEHTPQPTIVPTILPPVPAPTLANTTATSIDVPEITLPQVPTGSVSEAQFRQYAGAILQRLSTNFATIGSVQGRLGKKVSALGKNVGNNAQTSTALQDIVIDSDQLSSYARQGRHLITTGNEGLSGMTVPEHMIKSHTYLRLGLSELSLAYAQIGLGADMMGNGFHTMKQAAGSGNESSFQSGMQNVDNGMRQMQQGMADYSDAMVTIKQSTSGLSNPNF